MDYSLDDKKQEIPVIKTKKDVVADLNSTPGWKNEAAKKSADKGPDGKPLSPSEKKLIEQGEKERKRLLGSEQEDFATRIFWRSTNDALVYELRDAERAEMAVRSGNLQDVVARPKEKQDFVENRIAVAKRESKWRSKEENMVKELQKQNSGADVCTARELDAMTEFVKSGKDVVFDEKAPDMKKELDKLIDSVLSYDISLSDFNDEYLSEHITELYTESLKLKKVASLRDKKEYKPYFDSLSAEKKLLLDVKLECADAFHAALTDHMALHNVSCQMDKKGRVKVELSAGEKDEEGKNKIGEQRKAVYESSLRFLKEKLNQDDVMLSSRILTIDTEFSAEALLGEIEEKASADKDMYRAFRNEYRTAYGEIKRAALLREKYTDELKTLREGYKYTDKKEETRAGMRVLNTRILLASSHIDRYMSFVRFLNGEEKTIPMETRYFMEREKQTGLVEAIDLIHTLEENLDQADGASLHEFVKATKLQGIPEDKPDEEEPKPQVIVSDATSTDSKPQVIVSDATVTGSDATLTDSKPQVTAAASAPQPAPNPEEETKKADGSDPERAYTRQNRDKFWKALTEKLSEEDKTLAMPRYFSQNFVEEMRNRHKRAVKVMKDGKEDTDYVYIDDTSKELMDLFDWYDGYFNYQRSLEKNTTGLPKLKPIPTGYKASVPCDEYELQTGLNCWCCAGIAILKRFLALKNIDLSEDQKALLNQHSFRGNGKDLKVRTLKEIHENGQPFVDQDTYDEWVREGSAFIRGSSIGNIFEAADFFFKFNMPFRLNKMTFSVQGVKNKPKRKVLLDRILKEGETLDITVNGTDDSVKYDFTVKKTGGKIVFDKVPEGTQEPMLSSSEDGGTTTINISLYEDKKPEVTEKDRIVNNNLQASFLTQVNDILVSGNLAAVLIRTPIKHYLTITGIEGRDISFLDSRDQKSYTKDVSFFINPDRKEGEQIELTWFSSLDAPDELLSEFDDLYYDRDKDEFYSPLNTQSVMNVFQTGGVCVEKNMTGEGQDGIGYTAYIPKKYKTVPAAAAPVKKEEEVPKKEEEAPKKEEEVPKKEEEVPKKEKPRKEGEAPKKEEPKKKEEASKKTTDSAGESDDEWTVVDGKTLDAAEAEFKKQEQDAAIISSLHKAADKKGPLKLSPKDIISQARDYVRDLMAAEKAGVRVFHKNEDKDPAKIREMREDMESSLYTREKEESYSLGASKQVSAAEKRGEFKGYKLSQRGEGSPNLAVVRYNAMFNDPDQKGLPPVRPIRGDEFVQRSGETDMDQAERICELLRSLDQMDDEILETGESVRRKTEEIGTYEKAILSYEARMDSLTDKEKTKLKNTYKLVDAMKVKRDLEKSYLEQREKLRDLAEEALNAWFEANGVQLSYDTNMAGKFTGLSLKNASSGTVKKAKGKLQLALEKYRFYAENLSRHYGEEVVKSISKSMAYKTDREADEISRRADDEKNDRISGIPFMMQTDVDNIQTLIVSHPAEYKAHKKEIDSAFAFLVQCYRKMDEESYPLVNGQNFTNKPEYQNMSATLTSSLGSGLLHLLGHQDLLLGMLSYQGESACAYIKYLISGERTDPLHAGFIEKKWKVKAGAAPAKK